MPPLRLNMTHVDEAINGAERRGRINAPLARMIYEISAAGDVQA